MSAKYIVSGLLGSIAIAYVSDNLIADQKIFGGLYYYLEVNAL